MEPKMQNFTEKLGQYRVGLINAVSTATYTINETIINPNAVSYQNEQHSKSLYFNSAQFQFIEPITWKTKCSPEIRDRNNRLLLKLYIKQKYKKSRQKFH